MFEWVMCGAHAMALMHLWWVALGKNKTHFFLSPTTTLASLQLQEGQLVVRHFQFLRWSPYRDVPDSKKAFLSLLAQVHNWQRECGEGRTIVHCLWVHLHTSTPYIYVFSVANTEPFLDFMWCPTLCYEFNISSWILFSSEWNSFQTLHWRLEFWIFVSGRLF